MTSLTLDPSQELAVQLILTAGIGVVTGGPGTGKTTTLRTALDRLDAMPMPPNPDDGIPPGDSAWQRYLLAAPTGKAARRMQEATGREALTVHRLLDYGPGPLGLGFRRNIDNPIAASVVVIDESSMLDVELGKALLEAIDPRWTRLILVGDVNQLPSVGPGRVFADVIDSESIEVARLTTLHRSAAESWVCGNAPKILAGEKPALEQRADFMWHEVRDASDIVPRIVRTCAQLGAMGVLEAQVLASQKPGPAGVDAINRALQEATNPRRAGEKVLQREKFQIRVGDRVLQTSNSYLLGVMNGEIGDVVSIGEKELVVDFEGRLVTYGAGDAQSLDLAYALTIHKSQGSEWPWVIVIVHSTHSFMLDRHLLYTAATRAKTGVVLIGDAAGLVTALKKVDSAKLNTTMRERLRAGRGAA